MACNRCTSENQREFPGDITLCFDTVPQTFTNDPVGFTGRLLVCRDCGFSEVTIPKPPCCA
jgi:hypothetical protein